MTTMQVNQMTRRKSDYPIAAKIQQLRKMKGWTQSDVASRIGRAQSRIAKWELSEGMPNPRDLLALANAFGVPLVYLCDDEMQDPRDAEPEQTPGLSDDETLILGIVKRIGADEAIGRLVKHGESPEPPAANSGRPVKGK